MQTKTGMDRRRIVVVALIIAVGALGLIGSANDDFLLGSPSGVTPADPGEAAEPMAVPDYQVNSDGLSFGPALDAPSVEAQPDLILVVATNGKEGYVYRDVLEEATGGNARTPNEMLAFQENLRPTALPVFERDGVTIIGEFPVGPH